MKCGNDQILNVSLGKEIVELLWTTFHEHLRQLQLEKTRQKIKPIPRIGSALFHDRDDEKQEEVDRQKRIDEFRNVIRDTFYAVSILLRYFKLQIVDLVDMAMLRDIIEKMCGPNSPMNEEFAIRMISLSMSGCIDCMMRQKLRIKEILDIWTKWSLC